MNNDRKLLLGLAIVLVLVGAGAYIALAQPDFIPGGSVSGTSSSSAETPYGESIEISIGSESETSGSASWFEQHPEAVGSWFVQSPDQFASWFASYSDSTSQNVYEVDGTYKSQEQVTLSADLAVTHSNIASMTATVKIKASDNGDPTTNNHEYTLANAEDIYSASPTSDTWSTTPSISSHLTDIGGSTTSITVDYDIYCEVVAVGSISGDTLTAEVPYTNYGSLAYAQSSESNDATVTPSVSVSSWFDQADQSLGLQHGTTLYMSIFTVVAMLGYATIRKVK